jgi:hypothetical protein
MVHRGRDEAFYIVSGSFRPGVARSRSYLASAYPLHASQTLARVRLLDVTRGAGPAVPREMQVVGMGLESESAALKSSSFHAPAITTP